MSFGISNNVRSRVVRTCTPELFEQVTQSPLVTRICAEIADALEAVHRGEMSREDFDTLKNERKKMLPIFTPHATFPGGRRLNADAVPSGLSMYDIDHLEEPRTYFENRVAKRVTELGIVLAHITPSLEGLRLFFVIPGGMTLEEAQRWMSARLGDSHYDSSVKDYARSSFAVPADYILYIDRPALFAERMASSREGGPKGTAQPAPHKSAPENGAAKAEPSDEKNTEEQSDGTESGNEASEDEPEAPDKELTFKGIPYSAIISEWFRRTGGTPVQGERNDRLHRLAAHLRYITDGDEELLLRIIPRFGLSEEEMRALIHSACTARFYSMPVFLKKIIRYEETVKNEELKMKNEEFSSCPKDSSSGGEADILHSSFPKGSSCPPMPTRLPALIRLLVSRTPEVYRPAVAHAVFPSLAAHLHKVKFRYIDNVEHEATLMNVLMAGTGAGKDCISEPINRIMADIRRRDEENLRRERQWKLEVTSKGANKDKRQRPEGLVIQEIDADMTNPAFVMRMAEADGHFLYTKLNEIDQFDSLRGNGRTGQQFQIMCLAFDPGNRYGQTRVGTQSVTEKVTIRFNWNAATTIQKGKRYFAHVLTDGPVSRINFCTIPEREIGADMPVYGTYDADFDEQLRPYIENLTRATGAIDCPQAFRLARKLRDENAEYARLSQSRVYENLSFRANVIAWLKACVLYVANGCRWDKSIEEFVRWSLHYDMWCKMEFFGAAIEEAQTSEPERHIPGRRNLLEMLPDEFTTADAVRVRQAMRMDSGGTGAMLRQWVHRRYVTIVTNDKYLKLRFRSDGKDIPAPEKTENV